MVRQVFYVNTVTNAAQKEFPEESALPAGWDIVVSSTGEEYYMNMDTGQRSYELPMADVEDGGALTPFLMVADACSCTVLCVVLSLTPSVLQGNLRRHRSSASRSRSPHRSRSLPPPRRSSTRSSTT